MKCANFFWLRSAGFPADSLLQVVPFSSMPQFASVTALYQRREALFDHFWQQILEVGQDNCRKFARKLSAREPISVSDLPLMLREGLQQAIDEWQNLTFALEQQEQLARPAFHTFSEQIRQQVIDFLSRSDVAEAIFISNPDAAQRISALVAERKAPYDSRKKQKMRLGWSYAQRFCTKNDTCSFFGPIAWGRFDPQQVALADIQGMDQPWLAQRKTFFESWVIQRIAGQINSQYPHSRHLPLEMNPGCYLQDNVLHYPLNKSRRLSGLLLKVLTLMMQGVTREPDLCARLNQDLTLVIEHLIDVGIIRRGLQISPREPQPLDSLVHAMRTNGLAEQFINRWSACFAQLEKLRQRYATGDLSQRQQALEAINQTLSEAGVSLTRDSGKMYVGRYPVYEDCARGSSVTFSGLLQQQLDEDFAPLMALYRWLTRAAGFLLHCAWVRVYQSLLPADSVSEQNVSLLAFFHALPACQHSIQQEICEQIRAMLQQAWQPVIDASHDDELILSPQQMADVLAALNQCLPEAEAFPVFGDDFHSPDFMLAAHSLEALNNGDYRIVLGETHPGVHTLSQPVAAPFCPFKQEIEQTVDRLFGRQRLMLADSPDSYQRSHIDWPLVPNYAQLVLPGGGGCVAPEQRYPIGRARLLLKAERLSVEDIAGCFQEDLLCVCSTELHHLLFQLAADVLPRHDPRRIRVNRTVYKRRTWQFSAGEWPMANNDEFNTFVQWHLWQQQQRLPRWVFIKCNSEPKPLFVDFDNPLSLEVLASALKKSATINVSEMLPTPDDLWLKDTRGRVCCEVRTTFSPCEQEAYSHAE